MKKSAFFSLFMLFLGTIYMLNAQVFMTKITSIQIDGQPVIKHELTDIKLGSQQSITFSFDHGFDSESDSSVYYEIILNNNTLHRSLKTNEYTLADLAPGTYVFKVQSYNGSELESISAEKKFVVFGVTNTVRESEVEENIPFLTVALIVTILCLLIVVVFLFIKLKSVSGLSAGRKEKLLDDSKKETEEENFKEAYELLKRNIKKYEDENNRLRKVINTLNKTIQSLEEANVSLIEQKELLTAKKVQLEDLQKQKDELLAIKFHDLKNPANAIKGLVELLHEYDLTAQEQQEIMTSIVESSGNIIELVQAISEAFAKEKYEDDFILELALIQEVIQSVVTMNAAYAKKKGIRLLNNASTSMPEFKFDRLKMKEALDNLVNNAIKYSFADTDVTVHSYMTDSKVTIEIKDNGVGMTKNDLDHLFEKGAKLTPKPTGGEKSSGLGLWIVKKIVEGHGGKITCDSKKGIGTKFVFELPFKV